MGSYPIRMFGWFRKSDPVKQWDTTANLSAWFAVVVPPRGLSWLRYTPTADATVQPPWAVVPVQLEGEPTPDGPLAEVPASREPRQAVAVFVWIDHRWQVARTVMNLSAEAVLTKLMDGRK
jgi:hypothetical protein